MNTVASLPAELLALADEIDNYHWDVADWKQAAVFAERLRRLATPEQPGSAVQGEAVAWKSPFGSCVCNGDNACPGCNPNEAIELAREIATAAERRKHAPCMECGANSLEEAQEKCVGCGDKDDCHGCELWPEGDTTPPPAPAAEHGDEDDDGNDTAVWALIDIAERCGAVKDGGDSGFFWTFDLNAMYALEAKMRDAVNAMRFHDAAPAAPVGVDDAMVKRALCAPYGQGDVSDMLRGGGDEETSIMRAALTAALSGVSAPVEVETVIEWCDQQEAMYGEDGTAEGDARASTFRAVRQRLTATLAGKDGAK